MWVNIEQNTEEWHILRHGRITSSKFNVVMANTIKENAVKKRKLLAEIDVFKAKIEEIKKEHIPNVKMTSKSELTRLRDENTAFRKEKDIPKAEKIAQIQRNKDLMENEKSFTETILKGCKLEIFGLNETINQLKLKVKSAEREFTPTAALNDPAKKYAQELALERVTNRRKEDGYRSSYMDDGHLFEPIAIEKYEQEKICEVTNGGFNYVGWVGDSPDGNVGTGCIEVKSVISNTQWERLKNGGYDSTYKWQIQGHMWLGRKKWCDFVSYCHSSEFLDSKRLYVFRVKRDDKMISQLIQRINFFNKQVLKNIEILTQ